MQAIPDLQQQIFSISPDCYISNISNNNKNTNTNNTKNTNNTLFKNTKDNYNNNNNNNNNCNDNNVNNNNNDIFIASSIDYFTPVVDDPFIQGQITVCNVLSDIYAIGCTEIDHFLGILSLSTEVTQEQRIEIATQIIKGMVNKLEEANTKLVGGQTTLNPWFLTGGSVIAKISRQQYQQQTQQQQEQIQQQQNEQQQQEQIQIQNNKAQINDIIILTKPIGTRITVNMQQKIRKDIQYRNKIEKILNNTNYNNNNSKNDNSNNNKNGIQIIQDIYQQSVDSMCKLNKDVAYTIQKYRQDIKACTDITGFGLKGHTQNLNDIQEQEVDFIIQKIPIFGYINQYYDLQLHNFDISNGLQAETSGGILLIIDNKKVDEIMQYMKKEYGQDSWIIGYVKKGNRKTQIVKKEELEYINV